MRTTVAWNVHALIGKAPRVHSTCEIEEVEEEEVQEDSVVREEYRALEEDDDSEGGEEADGESWLLMQSVQRAGN